MTKSTPILQAFDGATGDLVGLHRIATTQLRVHEGARTFVEHERQEGKSKREALLCLKRHLARRVFTLLWLIDRRLRRQEVEPHINPAAIGEVVVT